MIGSLRGIIAAKQAPVLLIEVGGVGYELEAPMSTFYELPGLGQEVRLVTHLLVRDDAHVLYGFVTEDERRLFRNLLKVSGVGAKIALAILSGISVEGFTHCVRAEDTASLVKVPGIGRKTAERLIVEMRDRLDEVTAGTVAPAAVPATGPRVEDEAYGALVALGYKPAEAARLLKKVDAEGLGAEDMIREALKAAAQ